MNKLYVMSATKCPAIFKSQTAFEIPIPKRKQEDFKDFRALLYKFNDFEVLKHVKLLFLLCNFVHNRLFHMLDIHEKFLKYDKRKYEKREIAIYTKSKIKSKLRKAETRAKVYSSSSFVNNYL